MLIPFDQLFQKYNVKPHGVLHLGANTGQEAEVYAKFGIPRVIWVEAIPTIYESLRKHIARFSGQQALLGCLSNVNGREVSFNISNNEGQSSSFLEFGTHSVEHPTVKYVGQVRMKTIRVDTLLSDNSIELGPENNWFLNVDLQGAELLAMKGMGSLMNLFAYAYVEVNTKELYKGCPFVKDIDDFLRPFGLIGKECKMTGNGWGDKFYVRC